MYTTSCYYSGPSVPKPLPSMGTFYPPTGHKHRCYHFRSLIQNPCLILSQCTKCPLCLCTHPAYIVHPHATITQLAKASHLNCETSGNAIADKAPRRSKILATELSTPAKLDLCLSATSVCVICWVVRSNTQTPKRDIARKPKRTRLSPRPGCVGSVVFSGPWCSSFEDIDQRANTTGT